MKEKLKKIRKILISVILSLSCWFGIATFLFLCAFVFIVFKGGCDTATVNGVCEVSKSKDDLISNSLIPIIVTAMPITYFLYKKFRKLFYLVSIPSFLFGIVVILS